MAFHSQMRSTRRGSRQKERGYILLTLLLAMALLIIFAAAIVPTIKFQIERDREEELIHRGTQYSRAIRGYYKKFGRYPVKLEDLESTNNLRFLRKRYKDPTNCTAGKCADFKLLHFGEVQLTMPVMGLPGTNGVGSPGTVLPLAGGAQNPNLGAAVANAAQVAAFGAAGGFGTSPNPSAGLNPPAGQTTGSDSSSDGTGTNSSGSDNNGNNSSTGSNSSGGNSGGSSGPGSGQVFGGGPIVGVVSTNKKDTIREFNHKKKYNQWQFIYDPGTDRGGLLMTPNQPPLTPFGQQGTQNVNGQNGGTTPTGVQNGVQSIPNQPVNGQPTTPNDPNNPQQQQ